jgi:hypothetical protein
MGNPLGWEIVLVDNVALILGKVIIEEIIDRSDYTTIWANKLFHLKVHHN